MWSVQRKGMAIGMNEKRDESVEKLAEELESRLARKEEPDELEEIEPEDLQEEWLSEDDFSEEFWEDDISEEESHGNRSERESSGKKFHGNRSEKESSGKKTHGTRSEKESSGKKSRGNRFEKGSLEKKNREDHSDEKDFPEDSRVKRRKKDLPEEDFPEDDWEEEEVAPMKPWMMAVMLVGIVALAAIICAVLWHFTHLDRGDGDKGNQMSASAENSVTDMEGTGELSGTAPETAPSATSASDPESTASSDSEVSDAPTAAASPSPSASSVPQTTAPSAPQTTVQPGTQASATVQEPISGTTAMEFTQSSEDVTPKDVINLRSEPSTLNADNIVAQAKNGEILRRTGVNGATGWTRVEYNGETLYAVTQYLTTDLTYKTPVQAANPNRVNTKDGRVILFTDCSDNITPKEYVNLRTEPSTSEGESTVRCQISNGEVVHRTGYSPDAGWSRVEYNGEILYVVSSYVYTVE